MTVNHLSTSALYTPRFDTVQFRTKTGELDTDHYTHFELSHYQEVIDAQEKMF